MGLFSNPHEIGTNSKRRANASDLRLLIQCLILEIYAIKVWQLCQNMVKRSTFSENMHTPVLLTPDGETTSSLHHFCLKLHHFASQMTPIDTHFFILIPSKTRCKTLSNLCAKLATFHGKSGAKGLKHYKECLILHCIER